jgi:hypothetical protein
VKYRVAAMMDADGSVTMKTYGFPGVPIGKYKVVIIKNIQDDFEYQLNESTGKNEPVSYKNYRMGFLQQRRHHTKLKSPERKKRVKATFDVGKAMKVRY